MLFDVQFEFQILANHNRSGIKNLLFGFCMQHPLFRKARMLRNFSFSAAAVNSSSAATIA
jgi:hypothetical protein